MDDYERAYADAEYGYQLARQYEKVIGGMTKELEELRRDYEAALAKLERLADYTEACERMLNASPSGQLQDAREFLRDNNDDD